MSNDDDSASDISTFEDVSWPASTIMTVSEAVAPNLIQYFEKYMTKHEQRIWKMSMTSVPDSDKESADDASEHSESHDMKDVEDTTFRKCKVAKETNTLSKLTGMLDHSVDAALEQFVNKYSFFSIVSTKEEYTIMKFDADDFYAEHVECSSLTDENDGAARRLCVYSIIAVPDEGGEFEFSYQGCRIKPVVGMMIIFPSCPLHPLRLTKVVSGSLVYACSYIL